MDSILGAVYTTGKELNSMAPKYETSYTLIGRALDLDDQEAWAQLYEYYSNFIYHLLANLGVEVSDKDEVHQAIMIKLTKALKSYDQEKGRFRTWFATLVKNEVFTHYRKQKNFTNSMSSLDAEYIPEQALDQSDLEGNIAAEWKRYITKVALDRLRLSFRGHAIDIFELGTKGFTTDEICEKLGLSASTVYTLRKRVKRYLYNEAESIILDTERR